MILNKGCSSLRGYTGGTEVSTFNNMVSISGGLAHSGPSILPRSPFVELVGAT
ncbi:hypothetical protein T09_5034 [Trichinella sp. T9]|nr:hypothetical protein T09_5034 [Trichinella sp. T9]